MQKYNDIIQDESGNGISTATVTVYLANTGTLASIYQDDETTAWSNPFTVSSANYDTDGRYFFKAANGDYDIKVVNGADTAYTYDVTLLDIGDGAGIDDNVYIYAGSGNDFRLRHYATGGYSQIANVTGSLYIDEAVNSGEMRLRSYDSVGALKNGIIVGGAAPYVRLYYDGVRVLETISEGVRVRDNQYFYAGNSSDLEIGHSGTASYMDNFTGALVIRNQSPSENIQLSTDDSLSVNKVGILVGGATPNVRLYYDGVLSARTLADGLFIGSGEDLLIINDGVNGNIDNYAGDFRFVERVNSGLIDFSTYNSAGASKTCATFGGVTPNVKLYYDGTQQLKTTATGINISNVPTSSAGLVAGDVWSNSGVLTIV